MEPISKSPDTPDAYIDLTAIVENWRRLAALAPGSETSAVVKANAYGLGMSQIATALAESGCRTFFTAYASEAIALRQALGEGPEIIVFNGPSDSNINMFAQGACTPVLNSEAQIALWRRSGLTTPAFLHVDTGMNRLGLRDTAFDASLTEQMNITCLMSHLACADTPDHGLNIHQLEAFSNIARQFPNARKSLSNTAGICLGTDYHFDLTRPGIGLYGGYSTPFFTPDCALRLTTPIIATYTVEDTPNTSRHVGYGAEFTAPPGTRIAILSLGYADGFLRSFFQSGFCMIGSHKCPVIGRISMDLTAIDITSAPPEISDGDPVEIFGPNANIEEQANAAGTLSYELLTAMGSRINRHYVGPNKSIENQNS